MIWRRVVVSEEMSLRALHGVVQAVMGWDGIHLFEFNIQGVGYTSPDLCGEPASKTLSAFRFRKNAKFRYIYDMGCWWEHEIRIEARSEAVSGKCYPACTGGAGACPPEDCGGVDAFQMRREEAGSYDAMMDLGVIADFATDMTDEHRLELLQDSEGMADLRLALDRMISREPYLVSKFSRRAVNKSLRADEHRRLMHQQIM